MATKKPERVPSAAEVDLDQRLSEDYQNESALAFGVQHVNPNPLGEEEYVGTDAIYQNHANDTEAPLASEDGPERVAEELFKDQFDLSDVDEDLVVDDPGLGGQAVLVQSAQTQPDASDVTVGDSSNVNHANDAAAGESEDDQPATPPAPPEPSTNS